MYRFVVAVTVWKITCLSHFFSRWLITLQVQIISLIYLFSTQSATQLHLMTAWCWLSNLMMGSESKNLWQVKLSLLLNLCPICLPDDRPDRGARIFIKALLNHHLTSLAAESYGSTTTVQSSCLDEWTQLNGNLSSLYWISFHYISIRESLGELYTFIQRLKSSQLLSKSFHCRNEWSKQNARSD